MSRLTPLSNIPSKKTPHVCRFGAPARKSLRTEDGWIDVPWGEGEKKEYEQTVLGWHQVSPFSIVL